jgi:hypothetical protein
MFASSGHAVSVIFPAYLSLCRIDDVWQQTLVNELWRKLGDDEVRKAAYRGGRRTCQNLHEGAIRHDRG